MRQMRQMLALGAVAVGDGDRMSFGRVPKPRPRLLPMGYDDRGRVIFEWDPPPTPFRPGRVVMLSPEEAAELYKAEPPCGR